MRESLFFVTAGAGAGAEGPSKRTRRGKSGDDAGGEEGIRCAEGQG